MKRGLVLVLVLLFCMSSFSLAKDVSVEEVSGKILDVGDTLTDDSSEGVTRYVYGAGMVAAVKDSDVFYFHRDRLGSNSLVTDSNGVEVQRAKNLPFAQKIVNSGIKYSFTDKELDKSDLYYFGARYYDPETARFNSVDMIQKGTPYSYVKNNPFKYTDPTGLQAVNDQICTQGCHSNFLDDQKIKMFRNFGIDPDEYLIDLESRARGVVGYPGTIHPKDAKLITKGVFNWKLGQDERNYNTQVRMSRLVRYTMRKLMREDVARLTKQRDEAEKNVDELQNIIASHSAAAIYIPRPDGGLFNIEATKKFGEHRLSVGFLGGVEETSFTTSEEVWMGTDPNGDDIYETVTTQNTKSGNVWGGRLAYSKESLEREILGVTFKPLAYLTYLNNEWDAGVEGEGSRSIGSWDIFARANYGTDEFMPSAGIRFNFGRKK